ncbi:glycosyltransferase [Candidatus Gottesmanbacteria bacterium]|nr:glycosyltransferase [Candidatus Gottesmanbacteria bacterium]
MKEKQTLNVVIPVYNEEKELAVNVRTLANFLTDKLNDFVWHITIVDNASTDQTYQIARLLAQENKKIEALHLSQKGRGRAVKYAWKIKNTDFVAYMDVDLSTDLKHFPSLVGALTAGYDISIGSRNARGARVYGRNGIRTITSIGYIFLIKILFWVHFSDAQCGFKAATRRVVDSLVPHVKDNEWFFDTEFLILAEKLGFRIYDEPVTWIDNPGSTVRVLHTARGDLEGLWRLFVTRPWRKLAYGRHAD